MAATGGYGRGVLAPFSDIDLLFLTAEEPSPQTLRVVEYMLYFLWDLGLKVGHATRSIEDCLVEGAKDTTIRTALLDARLHCRRRALFADFHQRFRQACKEAGVAEYIAAKQDERAARHRRYAMAFHADGSMVTTSSPAAAGETISLLGTGFGPIRRPCWMGSSRPILRPR